MLGCNTGTINPLSEQAVRLKKLFEELIEDCHVEGPNVFAQNNDSVVSGSYRVCMKMLSFS